MEYDNRNMMEQQQARIFISISLRINLACTLFIQSTYPLYRIKSSINLIVLT